jgi:hypothetical protein
MKLKQRKDKLEFFFFLFNFTIKKLQITKYMNIKLSQLLNLQNIRKMNIKLSHLLNFREFER